MANDPRIDMLLNLIDQGYERKAWHGPNLRGSLRGVTAAQAAWRPSPERHNIWELTLHAAYWKYTVHRRIQGLKRGSFPLAGSNFWPRPPESVDGDDEKALDKAWNDDRKLLAEMHKALRASVAWLDPALLTQVPEGSKTTYLDLIQGIACHDIYHAGQIQLLKRLQDL